MAPFSRYSPASLREEIFLLAAAVLLLVIAACGRPGEEPPFAEPAAPSPCHRQSPEVCTTDDQGELHCRHDGEDL